MENRSFGKLADQQQTRTVSGAVSQPDSAPARDSFQISAPSLSLPKGGGAIRGMGEKFAANPVTGTGSMTVPIVTSPGRSGFGPQLSLSYDSGAGNGPFGFGWSLSLPRITRKTEKGLPKYLDGHGQVADSDVFILSGSEDLVSILVKNAAGKWEPEAIPDRTVGGQVYSIRRYRPRIEGLFARIERWTNQAQPTDVFWRSISKDNITTWYGKTDESRIADQHDKSRIFSWLICQSYDDKGNVIVYHYKSENSDKVDLVQVHEKNRTDDNTVKGDEYKANRTANRYLKRVCYGNREPHLPKLTGTEWPQPPDLISAGGPPNYYFEVVFDYEDGHYTESAPDAEGRVFAQAECNPPAGSKWSARLDPFSTYHAGFEVRTYRLCQRVLMFHHFPNELGTPDCLVRSTDFTYSYEDHPMDARNPIYSFLDSVSQSGYQRQSANYLKTSLPPVEFTYSKPEVQDLIEEVDPESVENLPSGLDGAAYQWTDLHGEGIPGILTEQGGAWFYKRNWSPVPEKLPDGSEVMKAKFSALETVSLKPNVALSAGAQFMDLAGDGQPDLVTLDGPTPGFHEHDDAEGWETFRPFTARLNRDTRDPNLRFVDLDGDGHADVLITEDDALVWHPSMAEKGFGEACRVPQSWDEEKGPRLVFNDGEQSIYLADLSGDSLTDLVRIRNGEVCYWPNLGYGRFGAKITMDHSPRFDHPDRFDQKRVRLADIDGSGTTDIVYLHADGIRLYFNQSGNSWSQPQTLSLFPHIDDIVGIVPVDLIGNGTACLVWSSPLCVDARQPMRYVNLMGGQKPHLLVKTVNNLGAETRVEYAPSTKFYLKDKHDGTPWITKLPFPVHVVERVETWDWISRNRFITRYSYHHGYFDGEEREFRGFGMVEQFDTEELTVVTDSSDFPDSMNSDPISHVPPVKTKTWFHTGAYLEGEKISRHFEEEYYREGDVSDKIAGLTDQQLEAMLLPDTVLPIRLKQKDGTSIPWSLTADEVREACRSLKGSMLRREVFARDRTDAEDRPYSAKEQSYTIELLQPRNDNQHAVFFTHTRESIEFHYERKLVDTAGKKLGDPRVSHAMTLEVDAYGNLLKVVAIGYGRRPGLSTLVGDDKDKQGRIHIASTENEFTNPIDEANAFRAPLPAQARTYEILKIVPDSNEPSITNLFRFDELRNKLDQAGDGIHDLPYEDIEAAGAITAHPYRRLIEHLRTIYRKDDLTGLLDLGKLESLALPGESYKLALTPSLVTQVYGARVTNAMLANEGKYVHSEGDSDWWIPSGRLFYSENPAHTSSQELAEARAHFFLPRRYRDPFHTNAAPTETTVTYDPHDLLVHRTRDAVGNSASAEQDYRVLQPKLLTDPNGNRTAAAFDTHGLVAATAVMGKPAPASVEGDSLTGLVADLTQAQIDGFFDAGDPHGPAPGLLGDATTRVVYDLDRFRRTQQHFPKDRDKWLPSWAATLARETHVRDLDPGEKTKIQLSFSYSDGFGRDIQKKIQAEPGPVADGGPVSTPRWVGSGWTIFNNKGKPVRQYEPFFSATHHFEFAVHVGVSPILFYDPVERVVATLHPNHTYEKVRFDPWQQATFDVNDTVAPKDGETGDPRTDPDVKGLTEKYFLTQPPGWQTWYQQRIGGVKGIAEKDAATKAEQHANTPTIVHLDALGRPFLSIADNGPAGLYQTRTIVDIEGNQREVVDAKDRVVMRYDYNVLGTRIRQASMEAGERWMLNDVAGKPIRTWDSRGHSYRIQYDQLRRPVRTFVTGADPDSLTKEILLHRTVYGEGQSGDLTNNLRARAVWQFDSAGVIKSERYDFKGNPVQGVRRIATEYKRQQDWSLIEPLLAVSSVNEPALNGALAGLLEADQFRSSTTFDALNRPLTVTTPDLSVYRPTFNEANLLDKVKVSLRGAVTETLFVINIDYNAKGQRTNIEYGNGTKTEYAYDPDTFRLTNLKTTRLSDSGRLQDLSYIYDPAGNVTHIGDGAQQPNYFNGAVALPQNDYTYDAIYRLIEATGREHIGQVAQPETTWNDEWRVKLVHPQDGNKMRSYTEAYEYDEVGNFQKLLHQAVNGNWTRTYSYSEPSLLQPAKFSNRLSSTTVGRSLVSLLPENYTYDAHGNMLTMPHLPAMQWDCHDQLAQVDLGGGGTAYYVYDATEQRTRKVIKRLSGKIEERFYLGGYELYRERTGAVISLERETLHVMDEKQRIALVETRTKGNDGSPAQLIRYQYGNHLSSASLELDHLAQVISYEEHYPYGCTSYQAVHKTMNPIAKRYRYTGKERDEETGFSYHGARYYAMWLGRWIATDPIGIEVGSNAFMYANDSPSILIDANGAEPFDPQKGHWFRKWLLYENDSPIRDALTNDKNLENAQKAIAVGTVATVVTLGTGGLATGLGATAIEAGTIGGASGGMASAYHKGLIEGRPPTAKEVVTDITVGAVTGGGVAAIESKIIPAIVAKTVPKPSVPPTIQSAVPETPTDVAALESLESGGPKYSAKNPAAAAAVDVPGYTAPPVVRARTSGTPAENLQVDPHVPPVKDGNFETYEIKNSPGDHPGSRQKDADRTVLEFVSSNMPKDAKGTVTLAVGGRSMCFSCTDVAFQFKADHPAVDLRIFAEPNVSYKLELFPGSKIPSPDVASSPASQGAGAAADSLLRNPDRNDKQDTLWFGGIRF
ncbi:MAG: hypothetical protein JSS38_16230 [Nitrospira sp.]|nr:hypothetical protein [Nitrospira sp.]